MADEEKCDASGSAFPVPSYVNVDGETHESRPQGMSLRDWFAATLSPPEPDDLCEAMGWPTTLAFGEEDFDKESGSDGGDYRDTFAKRWRGLTGDQRREAEAKCRYAAADAMLAARSR